MNDNLEHRYDFVLLFDVKDGNPNGDPDAGNMPRVDPETGEGLVTDVCLKRKVRNYVQLVKEYQVPFDIYIKEKSVLGRAHVKAFQDLNINLGEESRLPISEEVYTWLDENGYPNGLSIDSDEDKHELIINSGADKKSIKDWLKEEKLENNIAKKINAALNSSKARKPKASEVALGRDKMCQDYYDIRTFGAVLSLASAPNCGQVRGPVQLTFARSIDQVVTLEHSITRMAVATEKEAENQHGDNRTMGRKFTVPYAFYRCHGFVSAPLAKQTGFGKDDLELLWEALKNMFEHDRSAARGEMNTRKLIVFEHANIYGNAPAHILFERVRVNRPEVEKPARSYTDYQVVLDRENLPEGITVHEML